MNFTKLVAFLVVILITTPAHAQNCYSSSTFKLDHGGQDANGNHDFNVQIQNTGCQISGQRVKLYVTHYAPKHLAISEYTQWLLFGRGDFNKPTKLFLSDFPTGEYYVRGVYSYWIHESIQKSKKYEFIKEVAVNHTRVTPSLENGGGNDSQTELKNNDIGRYVDNRAPDLLINGLPTGSTLSGSYNVEIQVDDNTGIGSLTVEMSGQNLLSDTSPSFLPGEKKNSLSTIVNINSSSLSAGLGELKIRVQDVNGNARILTKQFTVDTSNQNPNITPTPIPQEVPPTTNTPTVIGEIPSVGEDGIGALMNILVQILTQLMEVLSGLNTNSFVNTRALNSQYHLNTVITLSELIKANKGEFKKDEGLKKIPRLTKRFTRVFKKSQKTKREKKQIKLFKKSNRILNKIMKNI